MAPLREAQVALRAALRVARPLALLGMALVETGLVPRLHQPQHLLRGCPTLRLPMPPGHLPSLRRPTTLVAALRALMCTALRATACLGGLWRSSRLMQKLIFQITKSR